MSKSAANKNEPVTTTAIAVLNKARVELRHAVDGGTELAEKLTNGTFRFVRKLTQRIDDASNATLGGLDGAVQRTRDTARVARARAAAGLARKAA